MDTVSSLVFRHGRTLALPPAALVLSGLALILLAFVAPLLGDGTAGLTPELKLAPFRWTATMGDLG